MQATPDTQWIDRFVRKLQSLAASEPGEHYRHLACELYPDLNTLAPEDVAAVEWDELSRSH